MRKRNGSEVASIRGAVKSYNGVNVVGGVTFDLIAGNTTILVGPNGSGKTTTMEMLVGLRSMTQGEATIAGIRVVPGGEHRFYTGIQMQSSGLPSRIKTKEVIRAVECLYADPADWEHMAAELGIDSYMDATVDNLSGGQRRRLDILCAAIGRPSLLVLDEPTSGVDPEGRAIVWDFVRSLSSCGCSVLASTHDMAEAEAYADVLLVMAKGKICMEGGVDEVVKGLGGDRRLRVLSPSDRTRELIRSSKLTYGDTGSAVVVVGDAAQIDHMASQIKNTNESADLRSGQVRLEDIFAVVAGLDGLEGGTQK